METTHKDKRIAAVLEAQRQKPATRAEELREILQHLDLCLARLPEATPQTALEIPALFDQADQVLQELQAKGMNVAGEIGRIEGLSARFRKHLAIFVRRAGGSQALAAARQARQPSQDRWWWHADEILAAHRRQNTIRWLRNAGILAALLIVASLVYRKFLAPDPVIQASIGHQQRAESLLVGGELENALAEIDQALAYTPGEPDLLVTRGVILEALGLAQEAAETFEAAREKYALEDQFYTRRALTYLMLGAPERALADSDAALALDPDSAVSYLNKGQACEMLGDIQKAIENYQLADEAASRLDNPQLQAIARINLSNALQRISIATPSGATPYP